MILSDRSIRELVESNRIGIDPPPDMSAQLQPASLDLRLGREFARFKPSDQKAIDPGKTDIDAMMVRWEIEADEEYWLQRGEFILATTHETVRIPRDLVARVEGRSSFGRLGLIVHSTAGFIDPGFRGTITLEMTNIGDYPIVLRPGIRICQLAFEKLDGDAESPYNGKYQGQSGVTSSRLDGTHL